MKGLFYQLKSVGKDKFCLMTFLLPAAAAAVLNGTGVFEMFFPGGYGSGAAAGAAAETQKQFFNAVILTAALFMGCTFNAVNMISEKEDGTVFIHRVLPMTAGQYVIQKIFIGFVFGCLSAAVTAAVSFRLSPEGTAAMLVLIVLSAFVSALAGLITGRISGNLMTGIVCIKMIMIVFLAVPLLRYLAAGNKIFSYISYLIPSSAAFEGVMALAGGSTAAAGRDLVVLAVHCIVWYLGYFWVSSRFHSL